MRSIVVVLTMLLGVCSTLSGEGTNLHGTAGKTDLKPAAYYTGAVAHRLTISSGTEVVAVLSVPQGVFLGLEFDGSPVVREDHRFPHTFNGNIIIRALREDEIDLTESSSAREVVSRAPVLLALRNVVVMLEEVENG